MANMLDCDTLVNEFERQSPYYIHFLSNTHEKCMNPLISTDSNTFFIDKDRFDIKISYEGLCAIKTKKPRQTIKCCTLHFVFHKAVEYADCISAEG